ncbi:MAG: rod shape-determining protein MreC [Nitrospirota bacterium]|nr:rod shape-determining protein MreC [Nitrospirota bacterium]MDH5587084.1 rod shape-determining protein MreC [Nitrospirota bacterium]MDH5774534.1 rod shape-determining protein MreC [Nitrospirota bacterium]
MPRTEPSSLPLATGLRRLLLVVGILFLLLVLFLPRNSQEWLGQVGGPLALILEGPLRVMASIQDSVTGTWDHYVALQQVWEENQDLQRQIQELQGEQNRLREHAILALEFQKLSLYQEAAPMVTLPARIIGRNVSNWYRAMVIDKGTHDGIRQEMGVITDAGVVGRVVRVNSTTSIILLLSDPNVAITGMIQTSRDEGIIQGTPQGTIQMKYLPPLSSVQVGDAVVTSGLTDDFPRGLRIGKIQQITKAATDLFQLGEVTPIVDFSKLEGVLVITSFLPPISTESPTSGGTLPAPAGSP